MSEKVRLERGKAQGWVGNERFRWVALKSALPYWRARRGWKIHRVRSAVVFANDRGRMSLTWWCGNSSQDPIPYKPECSEGLQWCGVCDGKFNKHQEANQ